MSLRGVIRLLAALAVIGVMGATSWAVWKVREQVLEPRHAEEQFLRMLEESEVREVEPGEGAFRKATEMIALGRVAEGREKLLYVVNFYPDSPSAPAAKRILGEMNLDELLSTETMEGKLVHKVTPGESFSTIAAKHETTLDCIMHLNALMDFGRLHPGDELVVMPLNLRVIIDPPRRTLSLWDRGRFLKEYPLVACDVATPAAGARLRIENKAGVLGERRVAVTSPEYRAAAKVLTLGRAGLAIRELPKDATPPGRGIFLRRPEIEELALVLRVGNEVEIRPTAP